jgi:site-specific DNA-methyltransferase (adenine-specific)
MKDIFNENVPLKTETPAFAKHVLPAVPLSEVYLEDCVKALKRYADNHFDLAIVDPPYGIGFSSKKQSNFGKGGINHEYKGWDKEIPKAEYWEQLFRVSKNQIVWGANYMTEFLKPSRCWISWYKMQEFSTNEFELAWTSFDETCKQFNLSRVQAYAGSNKIHPTEKPIKLYDWCLNKFANEGDLILDTHLGSGSSRIAAYKGGFNFVGFEIDQEYYEKQEKRFNDFISQLRLF